jgi:cholesterol oxidase
MASFDYDVVIIGSGFGGSVAGLRAAEKGYRVGVMESGKRWNDDDLPKSQWHLPDFLWFPAAELYRIPCAVETPWQRRFVSRFQ